MKRELLDVLCCPKCAGDIAWTAGSNSGAEIQDGAVRCEACRQEYPVVNGILRFVPTDDYTQSFGFQWNRFARTQLDSHAGLTLSRDRFFESSGWSPEELRGKWVLDVGYGAGRFAEVAVKAGAHVVAMDRSSAVDACVKNLERETQLHGVQGDVYHLPFKQNAFDFVYCLGVLQHTPDVERAFKALAGPLKPSGRLAVDIYPRLLLNALWSKYWIRPVTKRMNSERLFRLVEAMVTVLLPVSVRLGKVPYVGQKLKYALPVANYDGVIPLSRAQQKEWAILDTFDMLAPTYDQPQTAGTLETWFAQIGFTNVEVFRRGVLVGRGVKPAEDQS
ncbi:MAG: methyltransferase domain-containing protein [Deltaproteobacteria bacterium]|nr:methyltransferase domain-containing protein [Deltaproteobacteria bacterium]